MKTFAEQFKNDYAHYCQLGAARKSAFIKGGGKGGDISTTAKVSRETWEYPALATETKEDAACIRRVRAVQTAERLYAGILQDAKFRFTGNGKGNGKGKGKGKGKGNVIVSNGATAPARQTALA